MSWKSLATGEAETLERETIAFEFNYDVSVLNITSNRKLIWQDADNQNTIATSGITSAYPEWLTEYQLYDLSSDEGEQTNLYDTAEDASLLRTALETHVQQIGTGDGCCSIEMNLYLTNNDDDDVTECVISDRQTLMDYVSHVNSGTQGEISDSSCASSDISEWILDGITSLESVFENMDQIGNVDLSGWNVQPVTSMFKTFYGASSFNGNLTGWDTSNLQGLASTFRDATLFSGIGLSTWNTASVKNMDSTFRDSSSLTEDIGSWNVESVTSIARMFYNAVNFHSDTIGNWNVKSVNTMMSAFRGASSFNGNLSSWSVTSNLTNMQHSFRDAVLFDGNGIGSWYVVFD